MIKHNSPISGVAALGDRWVATAGYDNQVILWDQATKTPVARSWHDHLANHCSFSPDGRHLLTSSSDYTARLWALPELKLVSVFAAQEDDVEMSVFHPSRPLVATASRDHRVRVYDFSGALLETFEGHRADVISVEWARGADEVISSSDDGTIKRWSLQSRSLVDDIDMEGVETDTVAISSDGTIFAGNDEGEIVVLRGRVRRSIPAHDAGVKRLVLDQARGLLVSLSYDRTMRLWRVVADGLDLQDVAGLPPDVWPRSCAFAGSSTLVFGTFGATYRWYDYAKKVWEPGEISPTFGVNAVQAYDGAVLTVGDAGTVWKDGAEHVQLGSLCNFLTPSDGLVFTGGQLGCAFDALTGRTLHQHRSPLNCGVRFTRDGIENVVLGAYTGEGLLFEVPAPGRAHHAADLRLHANAVKGVAVSGDLLFSVCADTGAAWHRIDTLERVAAVPAAHGRIANGCAGLANGHFASISRDLKLRLWDPDQRATVVGTPHTHSIKCVSASADGRYVATGSYDGRIAVYDRHGGAWSRVIRPTTAGISSLAFDPARTEFLASSYDGQVHHFPPA
jgi:toxoflavin biosynthesis protein ToxC